MYCHGGRNSAHSNSSKLELEFDESQKGPKVAPIGDVTSSMLYERIMSRTSGKSRSLGVLLRNFPFACTHDELIRGGVTELIEHCDFVRSVYSWRGRAPQENNLIKQ